MNSDFRLCLLRGMGRGEWEGDRCEHVSIDVNEASDRFTQIQTVKIDTFY